MQNTLSELGNEKYAGHMLKRPKQNKMTYLFKNFAHYKVAHSVLAMVPARPELHVKPLRVFEFGLEDIVEVILFAPLVLRRSTVVVKKTSSISWEGAIVRKVRTVLLQQRTILSIALAVSPIRGL